MTPSSFTLPKDINSKRFKKEATGHWVQTENSLTWEPVAITPSESPVEWDDPEHAPESESELNTYFGLHEPSAPPRELLDEIPRQSARTEVPYPEGCLSPVPDKIIIDDACVPEMPSKRVSDRVRRDSGTVETGCFSFVHEPYSAHDAVQAPQPQRAYNDVAYMNKTGLDTYLTDPKKQLVDKAKERESRRQENAKVGASKTHSSKTLDVEKSHPDVEQNIELMKADKEPSFVNTETIQGNYGSNQNVIDESQARPTSSRDLDIMWSREFLNDFATGPDGLDTMCPALISLNSEESKDFSATYLQSLKEMPTEFFGLRKFDNDNIDPSMIEPALQSNQESSGFDHTTTPGIETPRIFIHYNDTSFGSADVSNGLESKNASSTIKNEDSHHSSPYNFSSDDEKRVPDLSPDSPEKLLGNKNSTPFVALRPPGFEVDEQAGVFGMLNFRSKAAWSRKPPKENVEKEPLDDLSGGEALSSHIPARISSPVKGSPPSSVQKTTKKTTKKATKKAPARKTRKRKPKAIFPSERKTRSSDRHQPGT